MKVVRLLPFLTTPGAMVFEVVLCRVLRPAGCIGGVWKWRRAGTRTEDRGSWWRSLTPRKATAEINRPSSGEKYLSVNSVTRAVDDHLIAAFTDAVDA